MTRHEQPVKREVATPEHVEICQIANNRTKPGVVGLSRRSVSKSKLSFLLMTLCGVRIEVSAGGRFGVFWRLAYPKTEFLNPEG